MSKIDTEEIPSCMGDVYPRFGTNSENSVLRFLCYPTPLFVKSLV